MLNEYKKAFSRPEIYIVILLGALVAVFGLMEMASDHIFILRFDIYFSAYQTSMALSGYIAEFFAIFLLPLFAVLPYSDSYFGEKRSGVHIACLTRQCRMRYFANKACVAWLLAVIAILIPYIINQSFCLIAFPTERVLDMNASNDIYSGGVAVEIATNPSMLLFMNNPLLRNMLHILYACYYGGGIALFAYTLTLYFHKNRALAIFSPIAVIYAMMIAGNILFGANGSLALGIVYGPNYHITSLTAMIVAIAFIYAGSITAILVKSFSIKDIL